ncbi:MAG: hypothetical protein ABI988_18425 [Nitrospirota bacterium]
MPEFHWVCTSGIILAYLVCLVCGTKNGKSTTSGTDGTRGWSIRFVLLAGPDN